MKRNAEIGLITKPSTLSVFVVQEGVAGQNVLQRGRFFEVLGGIALFRKKAMMGRVTAGDASSSIFRITCRFPKRR
jgi:hypothetical protein